MSKPLVAAVAALAAAVGTAEWECTGGWECGELPSAITDRCEVESKRCATLTREELSRLVLRPTAVLLEGCDLLPEFARLRRALEKDALLERFGSRATRLATNVASLFGPDNGPVVLDDVTLTEYITARESGMRGWLPHHAFNAYDQVNLAAAIADGEGLIMNATGSNRRLADLHRALAPLQPTIDLLTAFQQSVLTLAPMGADMPFHQHHSSWLFTAHGRKFWLFSEPDAPPPPSLAWNSPWDVIKRWPQDMDLPAGARADQKRMRRCLQPPGSILLLPVSASSSLCVFLRTSDSWAADGLVACHGQC